MISINLLPWREQRRLFKNWIFFIELFFFVLMALSILFLVDRILEASITNNSQNNTFLSKECEKFKDQMKEIETLQHDKTNLLKRIDLIQKLNSDRMLTVRFFDILPRITPEGINLIRLERKGEEMTLLGTAKSQSSIAILWKNMIECQNNHSPFFEEVKLSNILRDDKYQKNNRKNGATKGSSYKITAHKRGRQPDEAVKIGENLEKGDLDFKMSFKFISKVSHVESE